MPDSSYSRDLPASLLTSVTVCSVSGRASVFQEAVHKALREIPVGQVRRGIVHVNLDEYDTVFVCYLQRGWPCTKACFLHYDINVQVLVTNGYHTTSVRDLGMSQQAN